MATESVTTGLKAFEGFDSSIYMSWISAMSDMLLSNGDASVMDEHTLANYGGLMFAVTEAAKEVQDRERAEVRAPDDHGLWASRQAGSHRAIHGLCDTLGSGRIHACRLRPHERRDA